jgi:phage shock protein E
MTKRLKSINIIFFIVTLLLISLMTGCSKDTVESNDGQPIKSSQPSFRNIAPEEAKKRLDSEKEIILLDVRTKEEYDSGNIKGSILIPVDALKNQAEKTLGDKNAPIFVYCRSGNRSATAASILVDLGYTNVYNLGGIIDWPYEIVK